MTCCSLVFYCSPIVSLMLCGNRCAKRCAPFWGFVLQVLLNFLSMTVHILNTNVNCFELVSSSLILRNCWVNLSVISWFLKKKIKPLFAQIFCEIGERFWTCIVCAVLDCIGNVKHGSILRHSSQYSNAFLINSFLFFPRWLFIVFENSYLCQWVTHY